MIPRLDTIMSGASGGGGRPPSDSESSSPGRHGSTPPDRALRGTPPDRHQRAPPDRQQRGTPPDRQNGNLYAASSSNQHQPHRVSSGISTQLNIIPPSPATRRMRRKSTFEPRLAPHPMETPISPAVPMNFTSPLAQLFSPIVPDTPDGGFNGQLGNQQGGLGANLGQRRAARRSANDGQLAPGVAMFRRRAMTGMPSGLGASALSVTPGEGPSKEPSETVSLLIGSSFSWYSFCLGWRNGR
jgi:hypothetical protein